MGNGQVGTLKQATNQSEGFVALLIAVAERRDRGAFSELYRHYTPKVTTLAVRMGVERSGADEVAQEVMLAVWRRARSYDPTRAAVSTWIYAIARNRVIDGMRKQKRAEVDPQDPALEQAEHPEVEALIDNERRAGRLLDALDALPTEQAEVLRFSYFQGKSQSLVAEELNLPLGTVKSRTRLGLARLRGAMGEAP